jgi:hypothetical protein
MGKPMKRPHKPKRKPTLATRRQGVNVQQALRRNDLGTGVPPAELEVIKATYVGRINCLDDCFKEGVRLYRQVRKGEVPVNVGTRQAYILNIISQMSKTLEEIQELESLRQQLERLKASPLQSLGFTQSDGLVGSQTDGLVGSQTDGLEATPVTEGDLVESSGQGEGP